MLARLGNVLYWIGCIVAALIALGGAVFWFNKGRADTDGFIVTAAFLVIALIVWAIGRACRYVLSGN